MKFVFKWKPLLKLKQKILLIFNVLKMIYTENPWKTIRYACRSPSSALSDKLFSWWLQSCYANMQNNFYYVECRLLRPNWTHDLAYAYICSHSSNSPFLGEEGTQEGQLPYGGATPLPQRPALLLLLKSTCTGAPLYQLCGVRPLAPA